MPHYNCQKLFIFQKNFKKISKKFQKNFKKIKKANSTLFEKWRIHVMRKTNDNCPKQFLLRLKPLKSHFFYSFPILKYTQLV